METRDDHAVAFAVTTRSRLRSARFAVPMLRANAKIERQLSTRPGCVRFASVVMSPTQFWTISVWRNRHDMQKFMRSGAHRDLIWNFARWFESFWLMRWRPSEEETGEWGGLRLATTPSPATYAGMPSPQQQPALRAFGAIPRLLTAVGPSGAPTYEFGLEARRHRRRVAGGVAGMLRVEVPQARHALRAWLQLRSLRRGVLATGEALGCAIGPAGVREFYALVLFRSVDGWSRLASSRSVLDIVRRWPGGVWSMRWNAEHEFGHWDGMRVRRVRREV
jgi:hypothetical protein